MEVEMEVEMERGSKMRRKIQNGGFCVAAIR
jgi:hypothetical protein